MEKIILLNPVHPVLEQALRDMGFVLFRDFESGPDQLKETLKDVFGLVLRSRLSIDRPLIDAAPSLRFIAREGVGLEHVDVAYAESKGIRVFNSPEGSRDAVGEHALGMILSLMHHICRADRQLREGKWWREENRGVELKGKTVGILGYGNMGQSLARKLGGLEARVIAYDKYREDYGDDFAQAVSLSTLFKQTDVLSIHIPYSAVNHYFINGPFLESFSKPIYLINTARGLVLETKALVAHLESGKVKAAALDVLEYEEGNFAHFRFEDLPAPFHYLNKSDRVILNPHIAGWSDRSKQGHGQVLAEKIRSVFG